MIYTINILIEQYWKDKKDGSQERFGQWFINRYVKLETNELEGLWEAPYFVACSMISNWLVDYNYYTSMPDNIGKVKL